MRIWQTYAYKEAASLPLWECFCRMGCVQGTGTAGQLGVVLLLHSLLSLLLYTVTAPVDLIVIARGFLKEL